MIVDKSWFCTPTHGDQDAATNSMIPWDHRKSGNFKKLLDLTVLIGTKRIKRILLKVCFVAHQSTWVGRYWGGQASYQNKNYPNKSSMEIAPMSESTQLCLAFKEVIWCWCVSTRLVALVSRKWFILWSYPTTWLATLTVSNWTTTHLVFHLFKPLGPNWWLEEN